MTLIPRAEHPRPDWQRGNWLNLNGKWAFDFSEAETCPALSKEITVPFTWTSPLSGVEQDVKGTGWYRRTARFDAEGEIWLIIGAADYAAVLFINGIKAAEHVGGYGEIRVNVTALWKKGEENEIAVRVTDWDENCQTRGKQGYGEIRGIWQTVYLEAAPATHLERVKIDTKLDGTVSIHAWIDAAEDGKKTLKACFDGKEYAADVALTKGVNEADLTFQLENPKLWSCEEPHLYEGTVALGEDVVSSYFGVREIGYACFGDRKYPWITLNGKPIYLNGTLDQSFNPKGYFTLPSEDEVRNEVQRLKDVGLNMVRIHIKPEEPRKLYWLDKLGVLTWADMVCFWGEPTESTKAQFEKELDEMLRRDCNHPSIMAWIVFNETWGLFTRIGEQQRAYLPETQAWVRSMYERVKAFDPTRLVEDNSACNFDHVITDMNTWHFYINGYMKLKEEVDTAAKNGLEGNAWNYINGNRNRCVPLVNSECGMVWGVQDSAGDSDLAWQYHYMLNEYRLHENLCGFVFTEFHDVINEFNGYYRIDNSKKDFGYELLGMNMTLKDMHTPDFIAYDAPPCRTVGAEEVVETPVYYSSFSGAQKGAQLKLQWVLHGQHGFYDKGEMELTAQGNGLQPLGKIAVKMPRHNDVAALTFVLVDEDNKLLARNFCTFDVRGARVGKAWVRPKDYTKKQFANDWLAIQDHKFCGVGEGSVCYEIPMTDLMGCSEAEVRFEAGAKVQLAKDANGALPNSEGADFMHGYKMDPGTNRNSYFMTDEKRFASEVEVWANGIKVAMQYLPDDPADCNGVLSWHYQARDRYLDEAGSYGWLTIAKLTGEALERAQDEGVLKLELRCGKGGLALYGRNAGRFAMDIEVVAK